MGIRSQALGLAWRKTMTDMFGTRMNFFISAAFALISAGLAYWWEIYRKSEEPVSVLYIIPIGVVCGFAMAGAGLIVNWISRVPYAEWSKSQLEVERLELRMKPRFEPMVPVERESTDAIAYGNTVTTVGGMKCTNIRRSRETLWLDVRNISLETLEGCEAYLSAFSRRDGLQPKAPWQSMRLGWLSVGGESETLNIPAAGQRSVEVFHVLGNRVNFVTDDIPVATIHMLDEKAIYDGRIALTGRNSATTLVDFTLYCDAPENPPRIELRPVDD